MPLLVALALSPATRAHAFAPGAAATTASRVADALAARSAPGRAWGEAARLAALARADAEAAAPEDAAARHRFVAGGALPLAGDDDALAAAAVTGRAPLELAAARAALTVAYGAGDEAAVVEALAWLATAATDLADPFLTSAPDADETPGARARFTDLLDDDALAALARVPLAEVAGTGAAADAATLALGSAARRTAVEAAATADDDATLAALRAERLDAAAALAGALALEAWRAAGAPALGPARDGVRVTPNPARAAAVLGFVLPAGGAARLELFDVSGRRVLARELGARPAGPQQVGLGRSELGALAPGVYLARVAAGGHTVSGRLVRAAD
jgi:hypothetical protein